MNNYENYLSPYSWRYGSEDMRHLWSEVHKRRLWRKIWVALAEVQGDYGLVNHEQVADLRRFADQVDVQRALQIESQIHHDLMAELKSFAEDAAVGGSILHLGATSADIEDNADVLRTRQALSLILEKLHELLLIFAKAAERWAELPLMGYTHLQPAEPTTLGYRFALYAQDLLMDWEDLRQVNRNLRGKGFKGAVGTGASFAELIGRENLNEFELKLSAKLNLPFFPATSQVYPRKQDYRILCSLAGLGISLYKFAFDLRILQSPAFGELAEPFSDKQVGSSAMPFKRNPINAEKIDSLARSLAQFPRQAWDNAALSALERTLDDSANRRSMLPEAFLITDELLVVAQRIVEGLVIDEKAIRYNLDRYGTFSSIERVLMALVAAGADRQVMHERLRELSMQAWRSIENQEKNPLIELIAKEPMFLNYVEADNLRILMDVDQYIGNAPQNALALGDSIRKALDA
ncbi:MAG: adenylosuccinate lyase [Chloroflexota bacterium]|nr:MAG: adenylosuccinate lyase [Chloroflexota bacterium]